MSHMKHLSLQKDASRRDDQAIRELDAVGGDAADLHGRLYSTCEDVGQNGWLIAYWLRCVECSGKGWSMAQEVCPSQSRQWELQHGFLFGLFAITVETKQTLVFKLAEEP